MAIITEIVSGLWNLGREILEAALPIVKTAVSFILWVLLAIIILPCVYIAGNIYPLWEKWGENF